MNVIDVSSLEDIANVILGIDRERKGWLWFRGHRNMNWELRPTVWRDHNEDVERYMANRFYARARTRHAHSPGNEDWAGWISLMQHYGLPTRLLDWTMSALVAAFFATHKYKFDEAVETKACIWVLDAIALNVQQGFEDIAPPLNYWMAQRLVRPAFKGKDKEDTQEVQKVIAAMAVENDPRMLVQQSAFTIHTTRECLTNQPNSDKWLHQLIIPADSAKRIAWELEGLGVREENLFPDLGHLAASLRNDFSSHKKKT